MSRSLSRISTLAKRNVKEIIRDPLSLIFMLIMPLSMEILFYYIFHELTEQFAMKYLAPAIVVFSQAFLSLFAGMLIALDRSTSFLSRLCVSPARPYEFILGYAIALAPLAVLQSILFFAVGGIIDPTIWNIGLLYGLLSSLLTSLLFLSIGILLGSLCNEKSIGGVASVVIAGQSVLSGMWFPTSGIPKGFETFMRVLPFKNATDLVQNSLIATSNLFGDVFLPLLIVLAYTVAIFIAAILCFRARMKNR